MTTSNWQSMLAQAWQSIAGDAPVPAELTVDRVPRSQLPSTLPVADAAVACLGAALLAAAARSGDRTAEVHGGHLAASVRSERYLRVAGESFGSGFAPLSRFWRTADGWVRTHANYPWHHRALLAALEVADRGNVAAALAARSSTEVEERVVGAGGIAAAIRTPDEWLAHPEGRDVAARPLVSLTRYPPGVPRRCKPGIRVLDLTRVIAGPVATRYLAALGADVLRLDPPRRPELELHRYDGLPGKRSALLDAGTPAGLATLHELLDGADVLVHGYRPGALSRFGLDAEALAERHPGLVVVALSAWGGTGPWGNRRGFDSIVQAAVGIASRESPDGERPGTLPCQLLDHGTGYLCAAAALDGLRRQAADGGTYLRELSLARTAHWLLGQPPAPAPEPSDEGGDWTTTLRSDIGTVETVAPPGLLGGRRLSWPDLPVHYGGATASW